MHTIFDGDYTSDYHHGLSKDEYDTLQRKGRVWLSINQ